MPQLDKYAPYIYAAYGIAIAVLGIVVIWSILRAISAKKKLDALESSETRDGQS